ncbi:MAG: DSD1 family PLP-dependent enzyme [Candidatus Poribacteria bacterium]|nr:DSD1 family PLP-dependent enzyme [Candidatus Poribacteria bacterium]MDE0502728.1 DSD1 family PLP-dependent enzyme [Candidatus Poribacteria bacterium]
MSEVHPDVFIGISKEEIDTPALLIDLDVFEANIQTMAKFFKTVNAELRPHAKTHKTPIIAHKQLEAGAIGITCAKLGEAEAMVHSGIRDVLIANQVVGTQKIARLINLAKNSEIMVAVDDADNVDQLSAAAEAKGVTLRVLIEVSTGMGRCGVMPGESTLALARHILKSKALKFEGLMGYEGHTVARPDLIERKIETGKAVELLIDTKHFLEEYGVAVNIMSGGGTGTFAITGSYPEITEIQAGSYVFMDSTYHNVEGVGDRFQCSLTLLTTVVSRPEPTRIIVDAGMKVLAKEFGIPQPLADGLEMRGLSEEHGTMDAEPSVDLKPGEKLEILPTHCCTTVNLHDRYYGVRNGIVESVWEIAARGKSQ